MEIFFKPKNLIKNMLIIDGLGRSGKTALCQILPSLKKIEHLDFLYDLEKILAGISLGHITQNFGTAFSSLMFNQIAYDKMLSRNVNFRKDDISGVQNSYRFNEYKKRLLSKDGDEVVKKLKNYSDFFLFCTHNTMASYDIFKKMQINHKMIQLYRNPVDNVYSWYTRGWGKRFGRDPRAFTISLLNKKDCGPWHLFKNKTEWFKANEMEKCVIGALTLIERSIKMHRKHNSKNIFSLKFENLAEDTDFYIRQISNFLKTSYTNQTKKKFKIAGMPRKINEINRNLKKNDIKKHISKKLFSKLIQYEEQYKKNYEMVFFQ